MYGWEYECLCKYEPTSETLLAAEGAEYIKLIWLPDTFFVLVFPLLSNLYLFVSWLDRCRIPDTFMSNLWIIFSLHLPLHWPFRWGLNTQKWSGLRPHSLYLYLSLYLRPLKVKSQQVAFSRSSCSPLSQISQLVFSLYLPLHWPF